MLFILAPPPHTDPGIILSTGPWTPTMTMHYRSFVAPAAARWCAPRPKAVAANFNTIAAVTEA